MNDEEYRLGSKIAQALDRDCAALDPRLASRLQEVRPQALTRHRVFAGRLAMAGLGSFAPEILLRQTRSVAAIAALILGMIGTYYWNAFEDADDFAEIDSALLADDLPVAAYTDQGFHAWIDHSSSSLQQ